MAEKTILTIKETVERANKNGIPISEYSLRRALWSGAVPCRKIGRRYLISWDNFVKWVTCADGADNRPPKENNPIRLIGA